MFAALRRYALLLAVAVATFALAYDNGSFSLSARNALAIAVWWAIVLGVALGTWPLARAPRPAIVAGGCLAAFAVWTLASTSWAGSAEQAFLEFDRTVLYLGVFLIAVLAGTRGNVARWIDGLAVGIVSVAAVALASRCFPDLFARDPLPTYLPSARARLSFPVQYWNGLAILSALALPLLLRGAVASRSVFARGAAVAPAPILAATIYLTSSRGGVATGVAGALATLALSTRRWRILGAFATVAVGAVGAVAILVPRHALVDGIDSQVALAQGRSAAFLVFVLCLATGALWAFASHFEVRPPPPRAARAIAGASAALVLVAVVAAQPARRFSDFKEPPRLYSRANDFTRAHLLSGNGSGRWQFWTTAADEWRSAPLFGRGAGSYESWWAQHGPITYFVRDAHSLYLETAGELGLVGLALLIGAFGCGIATTIARARRDHDSGGAAVASLGGALVGYAVGAGIDWMWELTIVTLVGMVCLGLLVGPGTEPLRVAGRARPRRFALGGSIVAAGWLLLCAEVLPLLADQQLRASERASLQGDETAAFSHARTARKLAPWAASPYLQLALVAEQAGDLAAARQWIGEATSRDPDNWRPWFVAARIDTELGEIETARLHLHRAAALNPRSPLFAAVRIGK